MRQNHSLSRLALFGLAIYILASINPAQAAHNMQGSTTIGLKFIIGYRYDNLRMCVASPPGKKGGMIADIMLDVRHFTNERLALGASIPVMRPILFAAAFRMLQFEPEFTITLLQPSNDHFFMLTQGVGLSLHYGPDYKSERKKRSSSFFAAGPFFSLAALFHSHSNRPWGIGGRVFSAVLFSAQRRIGTVVGGAAEGQVDLTTP